MSRFTYLALFAVAALACKSAVNPPPPPVPPPPPPPNRAPVAVVGGPYESESGSVSFDGSASSDPDGDALTFAWTFGDGGTSAEMKPSHTYSDVGNYNVSLTVTDSKGLASNPSATTAAITQPAAVLVGAGNIATCGGSNDQATASLIGALPSATVFTLGDNVFPDGSLQRYNDCYAPAWGQFLSRTRAVLGNHDYQDDGAAGSFDYFGDKAGPRGLGYYSYDLGAWHIIVLNDRGTSTIDQEQMAWLASDLSSSNKQCTIAMWHVPLFLSSNTAGWTTNPDKKPVWDLLYNAGVELVLNGQQHNYERFAPMKPDGSVDTERGIREFSVGTGGESIDNFSVIHPNSEVRGSVFGVLKLTLKRNGYDWQFLPVAGQSFSDSGSGSCH